MKSVGVRELRERTTEILKEVNEKGEIIQVTRHGRVLAHLVPPSKTPSKEEIERSLERLRRLSKKISERVTQPTDSSKLMQEERRWS
ncbi:MAG: type II toxin-antitoxin system Phd/YefM family antitoxin [Chloroflexota bacterium]|jgi:prevent-host-death family protein